MLKSILIDATHFGTSQPTGVELYTDELLPLLSEQLLNLGLAVKWVGHGTKAPSRKPFKVEWLSSPHTPFWGQVGLAKLLQKEKPDLFFTPSGLIPLAYGGRCAMTVHDLAVYQAPHSFTLDQRLRLSLFNSLAAKRAAVIIVPSHYTRQAVIKHWSIREEAIRVVPHGHSPISESEEMVSDVDATLPYFLFTGRIELKKNLAPVVEAFAELTKGRTVQLVLAGKEGFGADEIDRQIEHLPFEVRERIVRPGYISEAQKAWLYTHATAVVVPCPVEGFGMPILEAFTYNTPVIAAQAGALPEVGLDAVRYVKQFNDQHSWYPVLKHALLHPEEGIELAKKGRKYLSAFTWQQSAQLTAAAFQQLMAEYPEKSLEGKNN